MTAADRLSGGPGPFAARLTGGDPRSLGAAGEVLEDVVADPGRATELLDCVLDADPLVRMRAADALEKLARRDPQAMGPAKIALAALGVAVTALVT